jgi:hypothetical protein
LNYYGSNALHQASGAIECTNRDDDYTGTQQQPTKISFHYHDARSLS